MTAPDPQDHHDAGALGFFRRWGYLIQRRAVPVDACNRALDRLWAHAPPGFDRSDPSTWKAIYPAHAANDPLLVRQGMRWQLHQPPQRDMWRDRGEELRAADVPISAQFAAGQRLPLARVARDDAPGA